jgi:hypothetical protein
VVSGEVVYDKEAELFFAHIRPRPESVLSPEERVDAGEIEDEEIEEDSDDSDSSDESGEEAGDEGDGGLPPLIPESQVF